jgi:acetyltransferase-like isoleucine patch superfamily enzyme
VIDLATLYRRLMRMPQDTTVRVAPTELFMYLYHKGFWSVVRGTLFAPRLRSCHLPFFLGRRTSILFPRYLRVGRNVAIGRDVSMQCLGRRGVRLDDNVRVREGCSVIVTSILSEPGIGLHIGCNTYIGPGCILGAGGGIVIGRNVTLGAHVDVLAENHQFDDLTRPINEQGVCRRGIRIEDDCWIGNRAIVLDGVTVGRGSVIGAGAIVTRDLPPFSVAAGNPARVLRQRGSPADVEQASNT